jgi:pimeloyl-ACP methyl ester carboxylesterase
MDGAMIGKGAMRSGTVIREIEIASARARPVRADLRLAAPGAPRPLVIVCHGFLGYKRWGFYPYLSERLAAAGFHVLTMSFSHCGVDETTGRFADPEAFARNTVSREIEDLLRAADFLRAGGLGPAAAGNGVWGLVGHSRGGAVALLAASGLPEVRSLVTWSTPARLDRYTERRKAAWRREGALVFADPRADGPLRLDYAYYDDIDRRREAFDLPAAAARLGAAHLMVHGERDGAVTVSETRSLAAVPRIAPARLEVLPGAGHTMNVRHPMARPSPALDRAVALSESWLNRTLDGERMDSR